MMKIPKMIYQWISTQNGNLPLIGLITFTFPQLFVKSLFYENRDQNYWGKKKGCVTLSFDCDFPEDVEALPEIVEMLKSYDFRASFAVVGQWIEKYPKEHQVVVDHGHEIVNHTYSHPDNELLNPGRKFRDISRDEKKEEVTRCHEICENVLGYTPNGLRIPHFKHLFTPEIYGILKELGYAYSSSTWLTNTTTYGLPFMTKEGVVEIPLTTCPKHPFTVFDTWHSLTPKRLSHRLLHKGSESYVQLFEWLIKTAKETGSYINIYMDPLDIKKIPGFKKMLDLLSDGELEVVTYQEYLQRQLPILDEL